MAVDNDNSTDSSRPDEEANETNVRLHVLVRFWLRDRWQRLIDSPGWKTAIVSTCTAAIGVLSSAFVVQISTPDGVAWRMFYKASAFYWLISIVIFLVWYQRAVYQYETRIRQFIDTDFCIAYMRSKCLPEAAERYKELIRAGDVGELKRAMDELKKVLK